MIFEEYRDSINSLLANPDTALTGISPLLDDLKGDLETRDALKAENETLNARIRDLQDTNMKLYLSLSGSGTPDEADDEPAVGNAVIDEFLDMIFKEDEE
jgi:hypothetical protein